MSSRKAPSPPPEKKQKKETDPIKGLKDALKAEQVMGLAQKVAAAAGGPR